MFNQTFEDSRDDEKQSSKNQDELSSENLNYFYDSDTRESFGAYSSVNNEVDDSAQNNKKRLEIKNKAFNKVSNQITNDEIRKSVLDQIKAQLKASGRIKSDKDFDPSKIQFQKIDSKTNNVTKDNSKKDTNVFDILKVVHFSIVIN